MEVWKPAQWKTAKFHRNEHTPVVHNNQDGVSTFDMFDVLKTNFLGLFLNNMPLKQLQNFVGIIKFCFVD